MDLVFLVYAISLLEGFKVLFGMIICSGFVALVGSTAHIFSWKFESNEYSWNLNKDGTVKEKVLAGRRLGEKVFKYSFIAVFLAGFANILLPSEKTAYMMVGAYATQKVAENQSVQETGKKVLTIIEQKLDSYIDEGVKEAEKKVKSVIKDGKN
jgi:hypothetical protein